MELYDGLCRDKLIETGEYDWPLRIRRVLFTEETTQLDIGAISRISGLKVRYNGMPHA